MINIMFSKIVSTIFSLVISTLKTSHKKSWTLATTAFAMGKAKRCINIVTREMWSPVTDSNLSTIKTPNVSLSSIFRRKQHALSNDCYRIHSGKYPAHQRICERGKNLSDQCPRRRRPHHRRKITCFARSLWELEMLKRKSAREH